MKYVTKSTVCSLTLVSVNDDAPMSYLWAASPGMMLAKLASTTSTFTPISWPSARTRSASIPMTVRPSGAMNSFGA